MWWRNIVEKYRELEKSLQSKIPHDELIKKSKLLGEMSKEYVLAERSEVLNKDLNEIKSMIEESKEDWLFDQKSECEKELEDLYKKFINLKDDKSRNQAVMLEIRPGAGGDEAGLFAYVLLEMYIRYILYKNWKLEIMSKNITEVKGIKEAVLYIKGENVYDILHFESGVHRVQRVPKTEASGRIHTSTATVAVLEEKDDIEVQIKSEHLKVDVYRSSGPGGQSVNTTDSAVRLTYSHPELKVPIVVCMQDEKSQHKNKDKGMKVLKARLSNALEAKQSKEISDQRKTQLGSGDRSERIRTYNFPQNRITDHRSKFTIHGLNDVFVTDSDVLDKVICSLKENKILG